MRNRQPLLLAAVLFVCLVPYQNCARFDGALGGASSRNESLADDQNVTAFDSHAIAPLPSGRRWALHDLYTTNGNCPRHKGPYIGGACTHEDRWLPFNHGSADDFGFTGLYELKVTVKKGDVLRVSGSVGHTNDQNGNTYHEDWRAMKCARNMEAKGLMGDGIPWTTRSGAPHAEPKYDVSWKTASKLIADGGLTEPTSGHMNKFFLLDVLYACDAYRTQLGSLYVPNGYMTPVDQVVAEVIDGVLMYPPVYDSMPSQNLARLTVNGRPFGSMGIQRIGSNKDDNRSCLAYGAVCRGHNSISAAGTYIADKDGEVAIRYEASSITGSKILRAFEISNGRLSVEHYRDISDETKPRLLVQIKTTTEQRRQNFPEAGCPGKDTVEFTKAPEQVSPFATGITANDGDVMRVYAQAVATYRADTAEDQKTDAAALGFYKVISGKAIRPGTNLSYGSPIFSKGPTGLNTATGVNDHIAPGVYGLMGFSPHTPFASMNEDSVDVIGLKVNSMNSEIFGTGVQSNDAPLGAVTYYAGLHTSDAKPCVEFNGNDNNVQPGKVYGGTVVSGFGGLSVMRFAQKPVGAQSGYLVYSEERAIDPDAINLLGNNQWQVIATIKPTTLAPTAQRFRMTSRLQLVLPAGPIQAESVMCRLAAFRRGVSEPLIAMGNHLTRSNQYLPLQITAIADTTTGDIIDIKAACKAQSSGQEINLDPRGSTLFIDLFD